MKVVRIDDVRYEMKLARVTKLARVALLNEPTPNRISRHYKLVVLQDKLDEMNRQASRRRSA